VESVLRLAALILGIFVIVSTSLSVFTALVVPRVTSSRVMRGIAKVLGGTSRRLVPRLPTYESRDRLMSFTGPAAMILLFVSWLVLLVVGFGFVIWWTSGQDFGAAMSIAGSSVFTLGIATDPHSV
jgi:hypothetical protein